MVWSFVFNVESFPDKVWLEFTGLVPQGGIFPF